MGRAGRARQGKCAQGGKEPEGRGSLPETHLPRFLLVASQPQMQNRGKIDNERDDRGTATRNSTMQLVNRWELDAEVDARRRAAND
jgi:hypothetical protein